jgi:serine/threonine protein kinase
MSPSLPFTAGPTRPGFVLEIVARVARVEPAVLARAVGPTDAATVIDTLLARGLIDRVAARALTMVAAGALDERDLRQLIDPAAVRARLARAVPVTAAVPLPLPLNARLGRYTVRGVLGHGRGGPVYRSVHPHLGVPVAIKVSAVAAPLRAEAAALAAAAHRNVVRLCDLDEAGGQTLLVTDLGGESLARTLRRTPALGPRRAFRIARGVLAALCATHRAGFVHGDVKPGNVLAARSGLVQLCDFGSARRTSGPAPAVVEGTWPYAAPECFDGPGSPRSDVYSLAHTLYHALTGRPLVTGRDAAECRAAHLALDPDPLHWAVPGVPRAASDLIRRMAARDPDARPSAREALADARTAFGPDDAPGD